MPKSLTDKIKSIRHRGKITHEEYQMLIEDFYGHDEILYNDALHDFVKELRKNCDGSCGRVVCPYAEIEMKLRKDW